MMKKVRSMATPMKMWLQQMQYLKQTPAPRGRRPIRRVRSRKLLMQMRAKRARVRRAQRARAARLRRQIQARRWTPMHIPSDLIRFPFDTVEETDVSLEELFEYGLGDLAEYIDMQQLEGWGFFKKIGRAFKKIGRKIKKFKFKKLFKVAIPIAAALGLGPLAAIPLAKLAGRFGGRVARLIKGGRVFPQAISTSRGPIVGLVTKPQKSALERILGGAGRMASEALIRQITGTTPAAIAAPAGSQIRRGKFELPIGGTPTTVSTQTISATPESFLKKHGLKLAIGAGGLIAIPIMIKMLRK